MTTEARSMNEIVGELRARREVVEDLSAQLAAAKQQLAESEDEIMALMEEQGVSHVTTQGLTLGITRSIVPQIKNWPDFIQYIQQEGAFQLMERRVHTVAWREAIAEAGHAIPGIEPYERIRLSVRAKD